MLRHPNCVAYYPLEEAAAPFADPFHPSSSADFDSGSIAVAGKFGQARSFDGTDDNVGCGALDLPSAVIGQMSAFAWVSITSLRSAYGAINARWVQTTNGRCYMYGVEANEKIQAYLGSGATGNVNTIGNTVLAVGSWYHVGIVYVPSTSLTIYVNGAVDGLLTVGIPASLHPQTVFAIGDYATSRTGLNPLAAKIDEVSLWSMAFQPHEIRRLMETNQAPLRSV